ncbi:MAG: hypothetical protein WKF30_05230 [Pyrinomonadaceae bacterium]
MGSDQYVRRLRQRLLGSLLCHALALNLITGFAPAKVYAQQSLSIDRRSIDVYAITNARIFTAAGNSVIERGAVVIRNGLIENVGAGVTAPADTRVIDGTGLSVYPGLIDANTALGMPAQPAVVSSRAVAGAPPGPPAANTAPVPNALAPAGLSPEIAAADLLLPGAAAIESARNAGLTAALTAPRDGIFSGQSAFINLSGERPEEMIVRSPVGLHLSFAPPRSGGYPASLMGVFAAVRQALTDAQRYGEARSAYERDPRGLRRFAPDKSLAALVPVVTRQMPVVMYAESEREISRALDLAQEFNLRVVIAGGLESWKVADRLRDMNVPVLLSLNFPKRTAAQLPEADPDSMRTLRERANAPKTANRLAAAGVRFAFQSGSLASIADFVPNIAKAIEHGLARDEALRAVTSRPAEIFARRRLGTIERGKIAPMVSRGDRTQRAHHTCLY